MGLECKAGLKLLDPESMFGVRLGFQAAVLYYSDANRLEGFFDSKADGLRYRVWMSEIKRSPGSLEPKPCSEVAHSRRRDLGLLGSTRILEGTYTYIYICVYIYMYIYIYMFLF